MPKTKETICIAMSGGVDSSVAAALLVQQGYCCFGAFMKNWSLEQAGVAYRPWEEDAKDAQAVCQRLSIPFYVFDFEKDYRKRVVEVFVSEYSRGRTPNPDVLCNKEVKFDLFLAKARAMGADKIATGHYARSESRGGHISLLAGIDSNKDQSYFLYTLSQKELPSVLFPIGLMHKSKVRNLAKQFDLPNAAKKDSQGICFIGPVSMRLFLQHYVRSKPGDVVTPEGRVIGCHDGVMFYTEGQRHGFDAGGSHVPLYVAEKRVAKNELVVVPRSHPLLFTRRIAVEELNWVIAAQPLPLNCSFRVRYRQPLHNGTLERVAGKTMLISDKPVTAVSIGQSIVLYAGSAVLGGGVIAARA